MNQSVRTFCLVGLVVAVLLLMYELPPLHIGATELRHINILSSLLPEHEEETLDVIPKPQPPKPLVAKNENGTVTDFKETWSKGVQPIIDYSNGETGGMDHFYSVLDSVNSLNRPVRIAYYGDSYIEGDILTGNLREMFQQKYGGHGVGWVDCGSEIVKVRRSITQTYSGITEFKAVEKPFTSSKLGISGRYFEPSEGSKISTSAAKHYPHSTSWDTSTLFFKTPSSLNISIKTSSGVSSAYASIGKNSIQRLKTDGPMSSINYRFTSVGSGTLLYGMALESHQGVLLDNFSMRASSGLPLLNIPLSMMQQMNTMRPYDLIILHFGLNEAVNGNATMVLRKYMRDMCKVVKHFHEAYPEASILIMGVPDRCQRTEDGIRTLKEVKNLVNLQQQMAADCNVSFLNFFEVMGGEGSVKKLVDRNMADKDYTHLSFSGGKFIASKLFPSFVEGLNNYKKRMATIER
jgi:lysophospholipase L1-like esterase